MPNDEPPTTTTRIDTELLRKARIICAARKGARGRALKIGDYLDSILRPVIEQDYRQVAAELHDQD